MKTFSFISYNCHLGVPSRVYEDVKRCDQIADELRKLGVDIVALCEVWGYKYAGRILERLEDVYRYHYYDKTGIVSLGHGLLILSKFPLYNNYVCAFKDSSGYDAVASKSFFHLCVQAPENQDFRLFFTHTQAGGQEAAPIRSKQLTQIREVMDRYYKNSPALFAGDLNVDSYTEEVEYFELRHLFKDFEDLHMILSGDKKGYTLDAVNNPLAIKWGTKGKQQRLDYIFTTVGKVVAWRRQPPGDINPLTWYHSDHYPIYTENLNLVSSHQIPADNVCANESEAKAEADREKKKYGNGTSVKLLLANNAGTPITQWGSALWDGSFQKNPPPVIPNGQWAGVFYHHLNGEMIGSKGGMTYQIDGTDLIALLGFSVPFSSAKKNKCFVKIIRVSEWNKSAKDAMRTSIEKGDYDSSHAYGGYKATGKMGTGTSPYCTFTISKG